MNNITGESIKSGSCDVTPAILFVYLVISTAYADAEAELFCFSLEQYRFSIYFTFIPCKMRVKLSLRTKQGSDTVNMESM